MSIFSGYDPNPWLAEKSLAALKEAVRLVDLANEPDTTPWYAKNLKHLASAIIGRLAPIVAFTHQAGETAAGHAEWGSICERGTFAMAAWCKKWKIEDPHAFLQGILAEEMDEAERDEKSNSPGKEMPDKDDPDSAEKKVWIYGSMIMHLMNPSFPVGSERLLKWLLFGLRTSEYADTVVVNKNFLPTDIGLSIEDTKSAYQDLYDRGLIQRVIIPDLKTHALALRLVVSGVSDNNKHPEPFQPEEFGAPGIRIAGQPTIGNQLTFSVPAALGAIIHSWPNSDENGDALKTLLQARIGPDQIYIDTIKTVSKENEVEVTLSVRMPFDSNDDGMCLAMSLIAIDWLKSKRIAH